MITVITEGDSNLLHGRQNRKAVDQLVKVKNPAIIVWNNSQSSDKNSPPANFTYWTLCVGNVNIFMLIWDFNLNMEAFRKYLEIYMRSGRNNRFFEIKDIHWISSRKTRTLKTLSVVGRAVQEGLLQLHYFLPVEALTWSWKMWKILKTWQVLALSFTILDACIPDIVFLVLLQLVCW